MGKAKASNLFMKGKIDKESLKEEYGEVSIRGILLYFPI